MAAATKVTSRSAGGPNAVEKLTDVSGTNAILTLSTPTGKRRRYLHATVKYSAAPTQSGVTFEIDSGTGAAYDALLNTGTANAEHTVHFPSAQLELMDDDVIKVTAPAGGAGITSTISITTEI